MKVLSNSLLLAIAFGGSVATATAFSVITSVTASGTGSGSFSVDMQWGLWRTGLTYLSYLKRFPASIPSR